MFKRLSRVKPPTSGPSLSISVLFCTEKLTRSEHGHLQRYISTKDKTRTCTTATRIGTVCHVAIFAPRSNHMRKGPRSYSAFGNTEGNVDDAKSTVD